ncbi:MAG: amidohydrolase family protein [Kiritimatiellae bacterium]|jgi:hypothetical protein|nr:amidohydrolase family protein [Kiritimatiellia bacterium]
MIFDANTAAGHWPFRKVPHENISDLKRLLKSRGITGAAVANTNGLFYNNCHDANLELAEALAGHSAFFAGVATLNPLYAAWEKDLADCAKKLGMKALRMTPQYHNYDLTSPEAPAMLSAATALGLPVFIPARVVDVRGRNWMDTERVLSVDEIGNFSLAVPKARIVVTESAVSPEELITPDKKLKYPGLYFEISRLRSANGQAIAALAGTIGAKSLLFGSGAPLKEVTPALLKLKHAALAPKEKAAIAWQNAARILKLPLN